MALFSFWFTVLAIVLVMGVVLNVVAYLVLAERKVSAYMQDRIGPNRVGPAGLLQPIVDGIKIFLKEDIIPKHVDRLFFVIAPGVAFATAFLALAVVPFGPSQAPPEIVTLPNRQVTSEKLSQYEESLQKYQTHNKIVLAEWYERRDLSLNDALEMTNNKQHQVGISTVIAPGTDIGILWVFAIGSLAVYGIILGGWSANNKYALLGSLRSSAQIISYEIPLGMSILGVILLTGSLNLEKIIQYQVDNGWNFLYQPLAFLLFLTAVYAECNRLPFDLPEAEQELVGGYHTEYSSLKLGLFLLGEYTHMITTSFLVVILFFGGWHFPGHTAIGGTAGVILKLIVFLTKVGFFVLMFMFVRWTIPRFRFDQLMSLAWQVMIPLALLNLVAVMIVKEYALPMISLLLTSIVLFVFGAILSNSVSSNRNIPRPMRQPPVDMKLEKVAS